MVAASFGGYTTAKKEFRQLVTIFSPFATIVLGCYRTPVVRVRIRHTVVRVQARNTDIGTVVRTTHHHGNVSQYRYPPHRGRLPPCGGSISFSSIGGGFRPPRLRFPDYATTVPSAKRSVGSSEATAPPKSVYAFDTPLYEYKHETPTPEPPPAPPTTTGMKLVVTSSLFRQ